MAFGVTTPLYFTSLNVASAQVTGASGDFRASQGVFCMQFLGSGTNAGFGNSALLRIDHSLDTGTNWFQLALITASGTGSFNQVWFSAGAYGHVRAVLPAVYSGATGTGVISVAFFANNQGG